MTGLRYTFTILAFCAGFVQASGIKPLYKGTAVADENYYNLNGQVADAPLHGVFIYEGKKVVKK